MARRFPRPGKFTPVLEADGKTMNQEWFDFFGYLESRGLGLLPDVSPTAPTNGQVLIFNSTTKLWTPGTN